MSTIVTAVVIAWAAAYEVGFVALGTLLHGWTAAYLLWLSAAPAGWVALAQVWGVVPDRRLVLATAVVTVAWIAAGFEANSASLAGLGHAKEFSALEEILNEGTKTLLGLAYLAGGLRARREL